MTLLKITELSSGYGRIQAVRQVSLEVLEAEIVTLLGPNGAGKTTLLKTVAGLLRPSGGSIVYLGRAIDDWSPATRAKRGLVLVPEGRGILGHMTVWENLLMGAYPRGAKTRDVAKEIEKLLDHFPLLAARLKAAAGVLSGGERQLLAIARAVLAHPHLLMLDEPSLGLAPRMAQEILRTIRGLRDKGITILLAEQGIRQALQLADRCYVMVTGRIVASGPAARFLKEHELSEIYLTGITSDKA